VSRDLIDALEDGSSVIEGARRRSGSHPYGILIVDDEEAILESLEMTLSEDYQVFTATNGHDGMEILEREEIALVIVDQVMPSMSGVELLEKVIECKPQTVRMMLTGYADIHSIVRAINDGRIYRYIQKPWEPDELRVDVKRALEAYALSTQNVELAAALAEANERLRAENIYLRQEVERQYSFDQIIGASPAMQRVFDVMEKVAQTDATVLLLGETGTGKDLVAHAIHYAGPRKEKRFVAQNCGALPDTLLESELFGHKRGAFTGAHADKKGLFEIADGGTIFLDEVGETEPGMQVRLLRVLQDGEIRPLGSSETRKVDVRVIAASNRDLRKAVEEGRFAHHFLDITNKKMGRTLRGFSNAVMDMFAAYGWSGNVRELENEIQRVVALAGDEDTVHSDMLSEYLRGGSDDTSSAGIEIPQGPNLNNAVDALKRAMILDAMREAGSKTRAAERLGIPRQSLQKMMKRLEIE